MPLKCWVCGSHPTTDSLPRHFERRGGQHEAWSFETFINNTRADSWVGLPTTDAPNYSATHPTPPYSIRSDATIRTADELKYHVAQALRTNVGGDQHHGFIILRVELGSLEPRIPGRNEAIPFQQLSRVEVLVPQAFFQKWSTNTIWAKRINLAEKFRMLGTEGMRRGNSVRVFAGLILERERVLATRRLDGVNDAFAQLKARPMRLRYVKFVISRRVATIDAPRQSMNLRPTNLTHGEAATERNQTNESQLVRYV